MSFTFVYYSSSDLFWCISISGILHNGGIPECDGRDVREHPPLWDTHSGELAGRLQCLEAIPSFIFIEKKHDPWKLQNFSGNTDLGHVFMFSPKFLQKMLFSDALSADQSTGSKAPAASCPGAGPTACAPEGRMRSAPHLVALGAPSAPLPWRASSPTPQVQSRHLPAGVTPASLFEGLEGTGQSVGGAGAIPAS